MIRIEGIPVVAARLAAVAEARKTGETDARFNAGDQSVLRVATSAQLRPAVMNPKLSER
jgi:hypothetical protein